MNVFNRNFVDWKPYQVAMHRKCVATKLRRFYYMALLTKDQILAARNMRKTEIVPVPEWFENGEVIIIELSGKERDAFEADMVQLGTNGQQKINLRNIRAKLVARCVVNPDDFDVTHVDGVSYAALKKNRTITRMFNDVDVNDLGDVSATALQRVFDRCQHLSGITKDDVDELVGDLKNDQSADFGLN